MIAGSRPDWLPKRSAMLLPVVGAHVGAVLLIAGGQAAPVAKTVEARLVVFDIAATPPPAVRPAKPTPVVLVPTNAPLIAAPPVPARILVAQATIAPARSGEGIDCDLTDAVQTAVRDSPPARSALLMLPRDARSVANAVMLWDGRWTEGMTTSTRYVLGKVREVVTKAVDAASPDCRIAVQAGPRLVVVPGTPDIVIAFGSGRWRWGDLGAPPTLTLAANDLPDSSGAPLRPAASQKPN